MITILGASGFIGSHLVEKLGALGMECQALGRQDDLPDSKLGNIVYCIGLTSDFRSKPFETVDAHVCKLLEVLRGWQFDSLLYLSSTRLYSSQLTSATEEDGVQSASLDLSDLYNLSKATGEALAFASLRKVRVARLSNVYGSDFTSDNFLSSIIKDAITTKAITLRTSLDSEKDYVSIDDVVDVLIKIAISGRHRSYNVASGKNVSHGELVQGISALTGCQINMVAGAPAIKFPKINTDRIQQEFGFKPSYVLDDLQNLVERYRTQGD
jgi:nucleoside-diphosphate-sugar epimerase